MMDDSRKQPQSSSHPTLDEIRQAHQAESDRTSVAIESGNVEGLRVSEGIFAKMFVHISPEERLAQLQRRSQQEGLIRTYRRIVQGWRVKGSEILPLIGHPDEAEFRGWANGSGALIPDKVLERISLILGIYKALRTIFPTEDQANAWPRKPNRAFDDRSALDVMLDGDLKRVRRYLDGQCPDEVERTGDRPSEPSIPVDPDDL